MTFENRSDAPGRLSCVHYFPRTQLEEGGVVKALLDLCGTLHGPDCSITLLTCDATDVPDPWRGADDQFPRLVELGRSNLPGGLLGRESLHRADDAMANADVVHLHTPWELSNIQLARRLRTRGTPYIVTIHGMLDEWSMGQKRLKKRAFLALAGRRFLESAARLHFTAEAERTQALRCVPAARPRSTVVPLIADLSPFDHLPGAEPAIKAFPQLDPHRTKILFLSRLHPKKGFELLLDAAALLRKENLDFQIIAAGPGEPDYRAELERLAADHNLDRDVLFVGMVRGPEKLSLYQSADVFVLPTHQENFGLVLVEALASGTPVVTTQGTDIWRELDEAGALIVPRTAEACAAAIRRLLTDPAEGQRRGAQGRDYVTRWLSTKHVGEQYRQLYREAIRGI